MSVSFCSMIGLSSAAASAHDASLRGLVLATLPAKREVVVRYDAMIGAAAGIATFRIAPTGAAATVPVGSTIEATINDDSTPRTLRAVRVTGHEALTGAPVSATEAIPAVRDVHRVAVGEFAPPATFVDQRGQKVSFAALHGQMVVLGFFYTRCKDVRECPFVSARFAALQRTFAGQPVHLVEMTLDPAYDTPAVLARYGKTYAANPARWTLATGDPNAVLNLAAAYDVTTFPDERVGIIHPERLVLIDQFGTVRELIDEGSWSPGEVAAVVAHDQHLASNPFERLNLWLSSAAIAVCGNSVASFSGFTDLFAVAAIVGVFGWIFYKLGRTIARGTT